MGAPRTLVGSVGRVSAGLGPAAICLSVLALPLVYAPGFASPFLAPKLALLLVAGAFGLAGGLLAWAAGAARPRWSVAMAGALLALLLTSVLSAALAAGRGPPGAPYAAAELARLLATIGAAAGGAAAVRAPRWRQRLVDGIFVSAGVVSLIGLLQHVQLLPFAIPVISVPGSTFGNRNMAAEAVALSLPFGLAAVRQSGRFRLALGLLVAELLFVAVTRARGAWIGAALGGATFFLVRRPALPRALRAVALPIGLAIVLAALLPGRFSVRDSRDVKRYQPGTSVIHDALDPASRVSQVRFGLWRRTLALYGAHPLSGIGAGNFPVLFPLYAEPGAASDGVMSATVVPLRPHDELLERLADTGPLGLAALLAVYLAAAAAALAWRRSLRASPPDGDDGTAADLAAAAAGSVAACFACGVTAFPLAMPATALIFGVALGILGTLRPAMSSDGPSPSSLTRIVPALLLAIVIVGVGGTLAVRGVVASYWAGRAERTAGPAALPLLARAEEAADRSGRFAIALRTAQLALRAGAPAVAGAAAERALALEPYSPHAWALRGAARLAVGDAAGAAADARRALELFADHPGAQATLAQASARLAPKGP